VAQQSLNAGRHQANGRQSPRQSFQVTVQPEQTPDPENRLRLSSQRNRYGQPGVDLVLRFTDGERRAHRKSLEIAAAALGLDGARLVRQMHLRLRAGLFSFIWHHTGTTRMHDDPAQGVVDADCRVHGVSNLFVAGSSVFPTSGVAAPTLTIVALALRLADHLRCGPRLHLPGAAAGSGAADVQAGQVSGGPTS
jgi:choline dehydrogenase-like flavoprotein